MSLNDAVPNSKQDARPHQTGSHRDQGVQVQQVLKDARDEGQAGQSRPGGARDKTRLQVQKLPDDVHLQPQLAATPPSSPWEDQGPWVPRVRQEVLLQVRRGEARIIGSRLEERFPVWRMPKSIHL